MQPYTLSQLAKSFIVLLCCLFTSLCQAQKKLTESRTNSIYTYIYKTDDKALYDYYQHSSTNIINNRLQNPVDSFKTGRPYNDSKLPPGNYIGLYADQNKMQYKLLEKHTAFMQLLSTISQAQVLFTDQDGNVIHNGLTVKYNNKPLVPQPGGVYTFHAKNNAIITVSYQGVTNFFGLGKNTYFKNAWLKREWLKIEHLFSAKRNNYVRPQQKDNNYSGFLVFNKPRYKPHDTVRFKAYIFNGKNKKPLNVPSLLVKLSRNYDNDDDKLIGTVSSYRPGSYEYSFVLTDSLDLDLDENYHINLEDQARTMAKDKDRDDEDDDGKKKHIIYLAGSFRYEEYELKSIKFSMRSDTDESSPGVPMNIYLKAADENGIPVPDGRVDIIIRSGSNVVYKGKQLFIPDTLWQHQLKLDPLGETRLILPDSIFPKADVNYTVYADFYNSANEHQSYELYLNYHADNLRLKARLVADTLKIAALLFGKDVSLNANLAGVNTRGDTVYQQLIKLPYSLKINPAVAFYKITADSLDEDFNVSEEKSNLTVNGWRKADTIYASVSNPRHLHFWYTIYEGKKLIRSGEADSLNYHYTSSFKGNINIAIQYLWAGRFLPVNTNIPYMGQALSIKVNQPFSTYPGQKVTTDIEVKDSKGRPVPDADITAWAITSKFKDYRAPFVPYFGKGYRYYNLRPQARPVSINTNWSDALNWTKWGHEMGLDSIEYYRFTHTDSIYRVSETLNAGDTTTQIAPFVVNKGEIIPVHVLYIDERPVYFSQAEQLQHYSFRVDSGRHNIRIRTTLDEIELRNVYAAKNRKLILSVRDTGTNPSIRFTKRPDTLTSYEAGLLDKYMIKIAANFNNRLATITQGNAIYPLNPEIGPGPKNNYYGKPSEVLVGPLSNNYADYNLQGDKPRTFLTEPDYVYTFLPGLLKQKSILTRYPFSKNLWTGTTISDYTQYAITQTMVDTLWQNYLDMRSHTIALFNNTPFYAGAIGSLQIGYNRRSANYFVKNVIVFKYDDPDYIRIYPGNVTELGNLQKGNYRVLFLLKKDSYAIAENIKVKPYGKNYYETDLQPKSRDSVSARIDSIINSRATAGYNPNDDDINNDALKLKEAFNDKYLDDTGFTDVIYGTITDKGDGTPIPGVTIKVKGTKNGAVTSPTGNFRLNVPHSGRIIISFIGYITQELPISRGMNYHIQLAPSAKSLNEVVVVGYGTQKRAELAYSVSTVTTELNGRVAGLSINGAPGSEISIQIRGSSSFTANKQALIVIDGMIVTENDLKKLSPADIEDVSVLKDAAATAIYGSQAANGALIIITKKKSDADKAANPQNGEGNIRKNFSDYAYWQPKLITDANGHASFTATVPDDITSWRTFVIGVAGTKATGYTEGLIKSFKPLSASFISPAFAVQGDKLSAIGKVMNYNAVPEKLTRSFTYNGKLLQQDTLTVANSKIDTLHFTASNNDSLTFKYFIKKANGYFDGEERKIPVVKQGVEETKGVFAVLKGDTTMQMHFDNGLGKVTLHAEASVLPTLLAETDKLRDYKYLCNEQLASKLKGLLMEKRIKTFLGEPFKHDKNINDVIRLINENCGQQGLWGWWKGTQDELWISLHVIEALLDADHAKYTTSMNDRKIIDYLVYQLESYKGQDKITCLQLLFTLRAKVDYKKYITDIEKEFQAEKYPSAYNHFRILLLRQEAGMPVDVNELLKTAHKTLFGNLYWGGDSYRFFDNSVQVTLLAYRVFSNEGKHPDVLEKIRGYLLEQHHDGGWRNTYESSLILETILPDVLVSDKQIKAPQLKLSGALAATVDKFPYTATFNAAELSVAKTGTLPVYITGYQQYWNSRPEKVSKDFTVDSWFEHNNQKVTKLKGGERVQLKVKVTAHGDGDFVMVEIPVPAGCSYESKDQSWQNNEVHREYFKEKVSIFCRKLKEGAYTFTVDLMPRFSGEYTLNPAKAELMYFPVFYGREGIGKIVVSD